MKHLFFIICFFILATTQAQTSQNDSIYFWKSGALLEKRSIKPADLDSITFKRPVVNIPQVTICTQVWATKNLDVTTYSDGTPIPQVTDPTQWVGLTTGAWRYYNNDPANGAIYGKLYNWYAAAGIYDAASLANPTLRKKLAPTGWHVPTDAEWTILTTCLGGESVAGGKMKATGTIQAGTGLWQDPNSAATNSSGFAGFPGGFVNHNGGFFDIGVRGFFWSPSDIEIFGASNSSWYRYLYYGYAIAWRGYLEKTYGLSVRCIKD